MVKGILVQSPHLREAILGWLEASRARSDRELQESLWEEMKDFFLNTDGGNL